MNRRGFQPHWILRFYARSTTRGAVRGPEYAMEEATARSMRAEADVVQDGEDLLSVLTSPMPSDRMHTRLQRRLGETDAETYFKRHERSSRNYQRLLLAQAAQGLAEAAQKTVRTMEEHGPLPDVAAYTTAMSACARMGDVSRAFELLESMRESGVEPTLHTYSALVHACARGGEMDRAFSVVELMKAYGVMPDQVTFTSLIHGCVLRGDLKLAWNTYYKMLLDGVAQPDAVTYSVLIRACAEKRETERALRILDDMRARDMDPTEVTYNTLMYACAQRPDFYAEAFRLFRQMKTEGLRPTRASYHALMLAAARSGDVQTAESVLQAMLEASGPHSPLTAEFRAKGTALRAGLSDGPPQVDRQCWNILLLAYSNAVRQAVRKEPASVQELLDRARSIVQDMMADSSKDEADSVSPDAFTLNTLLSAHAVALRLQWAEMIFEDLYARAHVSPDVVAFTTMLRMYGHARRYEKLDIYWQRMQAERIEPTSRSYDAYIYGLARSGRLEDACRAVEAMRAAHLGDPSQETAQLLLARARAGPSLETFRAVKKLLGKEASAKVSVDSQLALAQKIRFRERSSRPQKNFVPRSSFPPSGLSHTIPVE